MSASIEQLVHIACCNEKCGHTICMKPEVQARYRRTHETFRCPAGHGNHYPQETEEERETRMLRRGVDRWIEIAHRRDREIIRLRRVTRTCPLCDEVMPRTRARLYRHLTEDHGAHELVREEEEVPA